MHAFGFVQIHAVQGDTVEEPVYGTQGTQVFAEGPPNNQACNQHPDQHKKLPKKKSAKLCPEHAIVQGQQDTGDGAGGTQIFAVEGCQHKAQGKNDHQQQKYGVLHQPQGTVPGELVPLNREGDLVYQLLQKPEGAEKTADCPAQQCAEEEEKSQYVIGKAEFQSGEEALQAADGAGPGGTGTGVAVQTGNTKGFPTALINLPGEEALQVGIVQQSGNGLNAKSFFIQGQHTPYKSERLLS